MGIGEIREKIEGESEVEARVRIVVEQVIWKIYLFFRTRSPMAVGCPHQKILPYCHCPT